MALLFGLLVSYLPAQVAHCKAFDKRTVSRLQETVAYNFDKGPKASALFLGITNIGGSCYRRVRFRLSNGRTVAFIMTPDDKYIAPYLIDASKGISTIVQDNRRALSSAPPAPMQGKKGAPVSIVEFADFECPFCSRIDDDKEIILNKFKEKVSWSFREFPLTFHPWAALGAQIAACASLQSEDTFWFVHDFLYRNQASLDADSLPIAVATALDSSGKGQSRLLSRCMSDHRGYLIVQSDVALGQHLGVTATPTLFINGRAYVGFRTYADLEAAIQSALNHK